MPIYVSKIEFHENGSPDFLIIIEGDVVPPPDCVDAFLNRVERAIDVIRVVYATNQTRRTDLLVQIHGIVSKLTKDIAANKIKAATKSFTEELEDIEKIILIDVGKYHVPKYYQLTGATGVVCILTGVMGALLKIFSPGIHHFLDQHKDIASAGSLPELLSGFALVWCGASAGVWLNAHLRLLNLDMSTALNFDPLNVSMPARLISSCFWATIAAIIIYTKLIKLEVGGDNLADFAQPGHWAIAVLLGLIVSINEAELVRRGIKAIQNLGKKTKASKAGTKNGADS